MVSRLTFVPGESRKFGLHWKQYEAELRHFVDTFDEVRSSLPAELRHDLETEPSAGRRRRWKWLRR